MIAEERVQLAIAVYDATMASTESFEAEDHIGADVAYLMGAILKEDRFDAWSRNRELLRILRENFPPDHELWKFINIREK